MNHEDLEQLIDEERKRLKGMRPRFLGIGNEGFPVQDACLISKIPVKTKVKD
jgi:hypothetical protein